MTTQGRCHSAPRAGRNDQPQGTSEALPGMATHSKCQVSPVRWRRGQSQQTSVRPETRAHLHLEEGGVTWNHHPVQPRRVSEGQAYALWGSWHPSIGAGGTHL